MREDMKKISQKMLASGDPAWVAEYDDPAIPAIPYTRWVLPHGP